MNKLIRINFFLHILWAIYERRHDVKLNRRVFLYRYQPIFDRIYLDLILHSRSQGKYSLTEFW